MPRSPRILLALLLLLAFPNLYAQTDAAADATAPMRPPATPLITHDPYFSVWSMADQLTGEDTRHWTGKAQPLTGLVRIDGKPYRFLGREERDVPSLEETAHSLTPTRTIVHMSGGGVALTFTFLEAALPQDMVLMSRPVTYLLCSAQSSDGRNHDVSLYLDAAGTLATNDRGEKVIATRGEAPGLDLLRIGTQAQPVLQRYGDDVRINWGYFYLGLPHNENAQIAAGDIHYREAFLKDGTMPAADDLEEARPPQAHYPPAPLLNVILPLGSVGSTAVTKHLLLAYDDFYSIEYMHRSLLPYWRTASPTFTAMLASAEEQLPEIERRTQQQDDQLTRDLIKAGGKEYAAVAVLAYRQAIAAQKLVENEDGKPFFMPKENFSNGSISTVDVIYPTAPMFLLLNPRLVEAQLLPVMEYSELPQWKFPFAPHDLGVYPLANGQQYGGGEQTEDDQMPVEESGNMLILTDAIAHAEGNADFARRFWPLLSKWADYLSAEGLDPANQLSTDDFAGHLAHNANLSIKAIDAIDCYSQLAAQLDHPEIARKYHQMAVEMAKKWAGLADDQDHYKLAFDKPGSWSQKYNLAWDTILGLNLFPASVRDKEVAFYKTKMRKYGLPLDNRATYTKLDWEVWTATLTSNQADFEFFLHPIYLFLNETPDRVPMTDWYDTVTAKQVGFQARSVVGGVYMPLLADSAVWRRWSAAQ